MHYQVRGEREAAHGNMESLGGTKMGKIFEGVATCQRALNPMHDS
jgi:hypothetical protein